MFVAGWRHALRSEWPFIIIIKAQLLFRSTVYITFKVSESYSVYTYGNVMGKQFIMSGAQFKAQFATIRVPVSKMVLPTSVFPSFLLLCFLAVFGGKLYRVMGLLELCCYR